MFTISFIVKSITCSKNFTDSRFFTEGFDSEIPRQDKISRQDKIKHLIQIFVACQYKNDAAVLTTSSEQIQCQKGCHFFGYTTQYWHWFTCTRCSSLCVPAAPNVQIYLGCHLKNTLNRFHSCLRDAFTIPSAGSKLRTSAFCGLLLLCYSPAGRSV